MKVRPQETLPTFLWRRNGDMVSPYFSLLLKYGYILLVTKIRKIPPQKKIKRYLHVGLKTQQNPKKQYICCLISMWIFQIHPNPPHLCPDRFEVCGAHLGIPSLHPTVSCSLGLAIRSCFTAASSKAGRSFGESHHRTLKRIPACETQADSGH